MIVELAGFFDLTSSILLVVCFGVLAGLRFDVDFVLSRAPDLAEIVMDCD